ncbi:hypothetical protein A5713_05760 [Mycobacterium sp. E2497]|nr:hypothetical protein A9X04_23770 [Mycobacterium sp. E3247]OBI11826.1 hypothetical protein A5713_05760 [Mycobacterium sp. E2497]
MLTVAGLALAWLVLLPRVLRRHRDLMVRHGPFKRFLTAYNNLTRGIAGTERSPWGLLTHVGRRSGREYQTPLGAYPFRDGFLVPLGYGPHTDWYQNLMAAGTCTLTWRGRTYRLERPELISGVGVTRAWPPASRVFLHLAGIHDFVWLHTSRAHEAEARPLTSPVQQAAG